MASQKRERKRQGQAARRAALEAARKREERKRKTLLVGGLVLGVVLLALAFTYLFGGDGNKAAAPAATSTTTGGAAPAGVPPVPPGRTISGETPCPKADGSEERASKFEKPPPMCIDPAKSYTAVFNTSAGVVRVKLDTTKTPATTNNFVVLARYHYFDGSSFQRTDPSIDIIQGGAPNTQSIGDPGPGYTIKDEPPLDASGKGTYTYSEGDLVMARSPGPDSASAQYFFSAGPKTKNLEAQGSYVVFGKTVDGLDVLKKVLASHVDCPPRADTCLGGSPNPPVIVNTVTIEES